MKNTIDILIVGVGGQGIVSASDIISDIAMSRGLDVKKSEIHGMSQRGGVVHSFVRLGKKVASPMPEKNNIDYFLSFELMEALRWKDHITEKTEVVVNTQQITPIGMYLNGAAPYPEVRKALNHKKTYFINGTEEAESLGDIRALNSIMTGALCKFLNYEATEFKTAFEKRVGKAVEMNIAAFKKGKELVKNGILF